MRFSESFLPFLMDMTAGEEHAKGGLKKVVRNNEALIDPQNLATWEAGNLLASGLLENNEIIYYQVTTPILKEVLYTGESNRHTGAE